MVPFQYLNIDKKPVVFWHCSTGNGKYDQDRNQLVPSAGCIILLTSRSQAQLWEFWTWFLLSQPSGHIFRDTSSGPSQLDLVDLKPFDSAWLDGCLRLLYNHTMYIYIHTYMYNVYNVLHQRHTYIYILYDIKWLYSQAQHKHPVNTETENILEKPTSQRSRLASSAPSFNARMSCELNGSSGMISNKKCSSSIGHRCTLNYCILFQN